MQKLVALCVLLQVSFSFAASGYFFTINDIHLDLYYNANFDPSTFCRENGSQPLSKRSASSPIYGQYGCDSPYPLFESYLQHLKSIQPEPDFIIMPGDFSAHYMPEWQDTVLAIGNMTLTIAQYFPGVPVLPVLGNNDVFPDYQLPLGPSELLTTEYSLWSKANWNVGNTFPNGGYYSYDNGNGLMIIGLNTIYYSSKWCSENTSTCESPENGPADPVGQFAWLQTQLNYAQSNDMQVYIVGHIPPGEGQDFKHLWVDQYVQSYISIISNYSSVIAMQFFAHLHRDSFRLIFDKHNLVGSILLSGSLTVKDLNNPSFRVVQYDPSSYQVLDYTVYYADLSVTDEANPPQWTEEYTFSTAYGMLGVNTNNLQSLYENLQNDEDLFDTWLNYWSVETNQELPSYPDYYYICAIGNVLKKDFDNCIELLEQQ